MTAFVNRTEELSRLYRLYESDDGSERIEQCALFSRSGFKPSVEEAAAERDDLRLITVADIVEALSAN